MFFSYVKIDMKNDACLKTINEHEHNTNHHIIKTSKKTRKILNLIEKLSNGFNSKSLIRRASSSFKHNASFVARLPTIRRHKSQSLHSPGNAKQTSGSQRGRGNQCPRPTNEINNSAENLGLYSHSTLSHPEDIQLISSLNGAM